jgi:sulfur carrier protein
MEKEAMVTINGSPAKLRDGRTVSELLAEKKLDPSRVVVEYNRVIIPKEVFGMTALKEGDSIEILHFVGGG